MSQQTNKEDVTLIKKDHKYLITIYKGQSLARPDEVDSGKLIMFRLKFAVVGLVRDYAQLPKEYENLMDIVSNTDIDVEIIVKFLERKMDHKEVVKFMASLIEVYKIAKVNEKIGEMEMDEQQFKEFLGMLRYMLFKTKKNNAVF